jgi:hypothetical protein
MTKLTGSKWSTDKCGRCKEKHEGYSGKLDALGVEYVVCGATNKKMVIDCTALKFVLDLEFPVSVLDTIYPTKWNKQS